jgi:hypothetical protein
MGFLAPSISGRGLMLEIVLSVLATFSAVVIGVGLICIGMSNFIEWMDAE